MAASSRDPGHIKGAAFREFTVWYERTQGSERLRSGITALPESARLHLQPDREALGILAATWYPAKVVHSLLDALLHGVSENERRAMARDAAEAVMRATLRGIYRVLFRMMATPQLWARYGHRLWSMHYDTGELDYELRDATHMISTVRDWWSHHPFICELNCAASYPIFSEMGCADVEAVQEACISRGDEHCVYAIQWRA